MDGALADRASKRLIQRECQALAGSTTSEQRQDGVVLTFLRRYDRRGYAGHMLQPIARIVSILGHPLLVMSTALLLPSIMIPSAMRPRSAQTLPSMAVGLAVFASLVLGWSWWQVRRGRWAHIDASGRDERRILNRVLLAMILIGALLAWRGLHDPQSALALVLAAGIVATAMLTTQLCKLSLHLAFALYAAGLLWPLGKVAVAACFAFAVLVAWSRLRLSRHEPRDLVAAAIAGLIAAALYRAAFPLVQA
jgi:hypothetical protein